MNLESTIENMVKSANVELYDMETIKDGDNTIFRVYITSKDGINLDKCEEVSNLISPILDIENPVRGKYFFEVSSPGIERKLKQQKHYRGAIGETLEVRLMDKEKIEGTLKEVKEDSITIDEQEINFSDIKSAKTIFKW